MNPGLILGWLKSESSIVRIRAARRLAKEQHADCLDALRVAFQTEDVPWVKNALSQALGAYEETDKTPSSVVSSLDCVAQDIPHIESQAISDSIGQVLHELEPAIGQLRVVAREVINEFEASALSVEFEKIDELLVTFENWRTVEQKPRPKLFAVKTLVQSVIVDTNRWSNSGVAVQLLSKEEIDLETDAQLMRIILSNALRNAVEATAALDTSHPVTASFGLTDNAFWVSINDRGIGLPPNQTAFIKSTASTKPGHRGMGLAIVDKAVQAIGGHWDLQNASAGGAVFYLEVPKKLK